MNRWTVLLVATLCVFAMMGCSGGGANPVTPSDTGTGMTAGTPNHGSQTQTQLWGYWDITIDVENQTVEAVPNRSVMFAANVVQFLNGRPPGLQFVINDTPIGTDYTDVDIDVSLIHPLPGLTQYDGYDVRGIFIGDANGSMDYGNGIRYAIEGDQMLVPDPDDEIGGPDGYTRWWNPLEFTIPGVLGYTHGDMATPGYQGSAIINPYKYFADGLGPEDDYWDWLINNTGTSGVFSSGMTNTRNYYIRFPDSIGVTYGYAVVANWKGEFPEDHPAPAPEAVGCSTTQTDALYYQDSTHKGGYLVLDISLFGWEGQPSSIWVESTVLSAAYEFDSTEMVPTSGDDFVSTYHVEIAADNVTGTEGNEFWVIAEAGEYDYTGEFTPAGGAPDETLAAFFRYPLFVGDIAPCPYPAIDSIEPISSMNKGVIEITITTVDPVLEDGTGAAAWMSMDPEEDIVGTDVTIVDASTMTATFDIGGAALGFWDMTIVNGCGSSPATLADAFEMLETTSGLYIIDQGDLPDTLPYPDSKQFCVVGDDSSNHEGVFFFGNNYQVLYYPLDYSSGSSLYMTLAGNYGYAMGTIFGQPNDADNIELDATGGIIATSNGLAYTWTPPYLQNGPVYWWQASNPAMANALLLSSAYGTVKSSDVESEFEGYGVMWHYWNVAAIYISGVQLVQTGLGYPYDSGAYSSYWNINWAPLDQVGSVDGSVSDMEAYRFGVDSDPQGLPGSFDIIFYYLEGAPDDPGIEVFQNIKTSLGAARVLITTIDEDFDGTPVDCAVLNTYDNIPDAETQWLVVLEDYGDSTWTISLFTQTGEWLETWGSPGDGDVLGLDCDTVNMEIHVWADNNDNLEYTVFGYNY